QKLKERLLPENKSLVKEYDLLNELIQELNYRELPPEVVVVMNVEIDRLNTLPDTHHRLLAGTKAVKRKLLKSALEDLELVPKNYYRNMWLAIGMTAIGLPLGVVFSSVRDNVSFISIGLPMGLAIGVAIGTFYDKKAEEENRQLELEIN
ncbi:MAG TPA: hypothetical protein VK833_05905, partial [Gillisia sp.]|nr:hypothetical protein [Gillisia sp.]